MAYTTNENIGKVRVQAIRLVRDGWSTRAVARHLGYAQSTIVKWCKRRNEAKCLRSLPTRSSRPHFSPKSISKEIVARILLTRKETKRCAEVVHQSLKLQGITVSLSTVKRILSRYGMTQKRSLWKKKRRYPIRPDVTKQGDLVEFDTIHFVNKEGKRTYVHTAIDVYSRYSFALISKRSNCHQTVSFLKKTIKYFPFKIRCVQTDNGSEFGLHFTDFVNRYGMIHRHIHPRSPNENGHIERFNRTLQEEIPKHDLCVFEPNDISKYLEHYNTKRMHMGIKFQTPSQILQN